MSIVDELLRLKARAAIEQLWVEWRKNNPQKEWKPPHPMAVYLAFSKHGDASFYRRPDGKR